MKICGSILAIAMLLVALETVVGRMAKGSPKRIVSRNEGKRAFRNPLKSEIVKRITAGKPADKNQYNFVVKVLRKSERYPFCHGAIISPQWILTSALCFEKQTPKELKVLAGTKRSSKAVEAKVEKLIIQDDYDSEKVTSDLALIKLKKKLTLGTSDDSLKAIDLPKQGEEPPLGQTCSMAGHGYIDVKTPNKGLQKASFKIVSDASCAAKMRRLWPVDKETMFCADGQGQSACILDNGSPLACKKGEKWIAHGLFSWGHIECNTLYYNVFTRVSKFVDWIKKTMASG